MAAVFFHAKAKKVGAHEVLFFGTNGNVLEGSTLNFFLVKDGKVYTSSDDVLFGITRSVSAFVNAHRKFVLQVAKDNGIEVVLGEIHKDDLGKFDEAFISSTTREVCPVAKVDDVTIGTGKVGPVTQRLMQYFTEAVARL